MKRTFTKSALICCSFWAFVFTGCVREDLPPCPPDRDSKVELRLHYTPTLDQDAGTDVLAERMKRLDFYLFDKDEKLYKIVSDSVGPFHNDYTREVEVGQGSYRIVVWGNQRDRLNMPADLIPGKTIFDELQLVLTDLSAKTSQLTGKVQPTIGSKPAPVVVRGPSALFYGTVSEVVATPGKPATYEVPLKLDTKKIDVTVRYRHKSDRSYCTEPVHLLTQVWFNCNDGAFDFNNRIVPGCPPFYYGPQIAADTVTHSGIVAAIKKMTLHQDCKAKLQLMQIDNSGQVTSSLTYNLMTLIRATGKYATQEALDREEHFHIVFELSCDHENKPVPPDHPIPPNPPVDPPNPPIAPNPPEPPYPPIDPPIDPPVPPVDPSDVVDIIVNGWRVRLNDTEIEGM